jgi:uncharacterized membrane protein
MESMKRVGGIILWLAFLAGFSLSIVSLMDFCKEACKETHEYEFFGIPIGWLGIGFFSAVMVCHYLRWDWIVSLMIGGALGSEIVFLLIQYEIIGEWCPVCVSIAACIFIAAAILTIGYFKKLWNYLRLGLKSMISRQVLKGVSTISCVMLGFFLALFGVIKPEKTFADGTSENENPIFGNRDSSIEVYVISDWFCPSCKELEPKIEAILPRVLEKASVIFVDRNIHPESMNYMPYNLSFMLKEKEKYFALRKVLLKMTADTKTPTPDQVQAAINSLGVKYKPLNFSDIDSGHRFFQGIAKTFQVDSTPTVVIANKRKVKAKKLVGNEEITEKAILGWINKLS